MKHGVLWSVRIALLSCCASYAAQPSDPPARAVPVEPIAAVIDAFQTHAVVALGEGTHGNEQSHAFRLALIRDPRFADTVDDIVVECGNSRYQDVMDRFVRGEDVSDDVLRLAWQNTTQPGPIWDSPIYEELFRAVRSLNASRPRERQVRILLGDPPIDWAAVRRTQDVVMGDRDGVPAEIIQREVLAKGRRALVVYGDMHLLRKDPETNYESARTIVSLLEQGGTKIFTIWTHTTVDLVAVQSDVASWARPSLTLLRGTGLGAKDFTFYYPFVTRRVTFRNDAPVPVPPEQWKSLRMDEQFDALLYLGPRSAMTWATLARTRCADRAYMEMRLWRMALMPGMRGEIDQLKRHCAAQASK